MPHDGVPRDVCVIGGNRYFGKRLISRLLDAGASVTVVNRGSAAPPPGAAHVIADRDDEAALRTALGDRTFDVVLDQVCYTPVQADIARRVFTGRTRRYVMTSTIEVYDGVADASDLLPETAFDAASRPVDRAPAEPWSYGEGKRQAEAVFAADPAFPSVAVRTAHVLGGADDFTGRLAHYADRIRTGAPIAVPPAVHPSTFIHVDEIADFLFWTAGQEFTGPVNACSHGLVDAAELCRLLAERIPGGRAVLKAAPEGPYSPFAFDRFYAMDNSRATALGFAFRDTAAWLPDVVAAAATAPHAIQGDH
ncbi:NAD-dependent epimerase/dehydratase family protein [Streptomyces sp. NPDC021100]|uniref:NAD-dependent epimerase/dehydratase family protein n=1 Tax=Streptomyces sp. NPDC021100 TaxID=3365114 RepID=UPI0037AECB1D